MRGTLVLAGLLLVSATPSWAQTLEQQLQAEVTRFVETVNRGDPRALVELYLDRPGVGSIGDGQISRGWQTVAELLELVYGQVGSIRMTVDSVTVMPLGRDAGIAYFRYRWILGRGTPRAWWGAMTLVFVRTADGWRVAHDHTSSLPAHSFAALPAAAPRDSGPRAPIRQPSTCLVSRIVDGDTFECSRVGRIRLIGMDTPELSQAPFGVMATQALAALIPVGSSVELERDVELRDQYGRLLAYVWSDGLLVNWMLVRQGWAVLLTYPPNVQYVEWFTAAQQQARADRVGLWAIDAFECLPADHRRGRCE